MDSGSYPGFVNTGPLFVFALLCVDDPFHPHTYYQVVVATVGPSGGGGREPYLFQGGGRGHSADPRPFPRCSSTAVCSAGPRPGANTASQW